MFNYGTIRKFEMARFTVIVDAIEDDCGLDDLHSEADAQDEIRRNLESGKWIQFTARARVLLEGNEIASDYLGGCIYDSIEAFADHKECGRQNREYAQRGIEGRCGSYFSEMIRTVCTEARNEVRKLQSVHVRNV